MNKIIEVMAGPVNGTKRQMTFFVDKIASITRQSDTESYIKLVNGEVFETNVPYDTLVGVSRGMIGW